MESYAEFMQRKIKDADDWSENHEGEGEAVLDPEGKDDWHTYRNEKDEQGEVLLIPEDEDAYWKDQRQKHEEGEEEVFLDSEEEGYWYEYLREQQTKRIDLELELLEGAISFDAIHPPAQQLQLEDPASSRPVLRSYLAKNGCIDHFLVAACAVHELYALALDKDGLFWTNDGLLNQQHYQQTFPWPELPEWTPYHDDANSSTWIHASRASAIVKMEHTRLAKKFTIDEDWVQLFPSIVSKSVGLRFLSRGSSSRNPDGSIQLIQIQLQATTRLVPEMNFVVLRTCKQIDHLTWVVADVTVDSELNVGYPCGCLIQGMADGSSKVTWVEHLELEESYINPKLYSDLCGRGFAFGAERWVACLQRSCERRSYHRPEADFIFCARVVGQDLLDYEKRCVMRFSKRMVRQFCLNIRSFGWQNPRSWGVSAPRQSRLLIKINHSPYHDDPREIVVLATITFSLPHSPEFVLKILGDERRRHELDASGRIGRLTEVASYTTGDDPRNKISVQANDQSSGNNELLLQETSVSRSGSLVVWSLLKSEPSFDLAKLGQNPHKYPLIGLSGIAISSNSHHNTTASSNTTSGGSYVTLGLQHEARRVKGAWPTVKKAVAECMRDTVLKIEKALKNPKDEEGRRGSPNKRKRETSDCLYSRL